MAGRQKIEFPIPCNNAATSMELAIPCNPYTPDNNAEEYKTMHVLQYTHHS